MRALQLSEAERESMARRARERVLVEHTADARVRTLEALLEQAKSQTTPTLAETGAR